MVEKTLVSFPLPHSTISMFVVSAIVSRGIGNENAKKEKRKIAPTAQMEARSNQNVIENLQYDPYAEQ